LYTGVNTVTSGIGGKRKPLEGGIAARRMPSNA
jgi:hypothetical protein